MAKLGDAKATKKPQTKASDGETVIIVVQRACLNVLLFLGMIHPNVHARSLHNPDSSRQTILWNVWWVFLVINQLYMHSGDLWSTYINHKAPLRKPEFFALLYVIYQTMTAVRYWTVWFSFRRSTAHLPKLLKETAGFRSFTTSARYITAYRMLAVALAMATAGGLAAQIVSESILVGEYCKTPSQHSSILFGLTTIPCGTITVYHVCFHTVTFWSYVIPQGLMISFLVKLSAEFRDVTSSLENSVQHFSSDKFTNILDDSTQRFRKIRKAVQTINETFSFVSLMDCVSELFALVTVVATFLEFYPEKDRTETDMEFIARLVLQGAVIEGLRGTAVVILGCFLVRMAVCIEFNEQEESLGVILDQIATASADPDIQHKSTRLHREIRTSDTELSAGRFFSLNKDYVKTVVGVLLTYFVLIYQTRQGKEDTIGLRSDLITLGKVFLRNFSAAPDMD